MSIELSKPLRLTIGLIGTAALAPTVWLGLEARGDAATARPHTTVQHTHYQSAGRDYVVATPEYYGYNEGLARHAATEGTLDGLMGVAAIAAIGVALAARTKSEKING